MSHPVRHVVAGCRYPRRELVCRRAAPRARPGHAFQHHSLRLVRHHAWRHHNYSLRNLNTTGVCWRRIVHRHVHWRHGRHRWCERHRSAGQRRHCRELRRIRPARATRLEVLRTLRAPPLPPPSPAKYHSTAADDPEHNQERLACDRDLRLRLLVAVRLIDVRRVCGWRRGREQWQGWRRRWW